MSDETPARKCPCSCHNEVIETGIVASAPVDLLDPIEMALSCHRCFSWHEHARRRRPPQAA